MKKLWVFGLLLFFGTPVFSQEQRANIQQRDSSSFIYEHQMRFIGSSTYIDMNYQYVLEHLIEQLHKNPKWKVHVRGHVCCGPSEKISKKRAKTVYKFLIKSGIDPSRVSYKGYSDSIPFAFPEKTEEDEAANRRVDFVIKTK